MYVLISNLFVISLFSDSGALSGLVMAMALVASSVVSSGFSNAFPRASLNPYSTGPPTGLLHLELDPVLIAKYVVFLACSTVGVFSGSYFLFSRYDQYRSDGGTKSYGNFLIASLNKIVFDMPVQELLGADFSKSARKSTRSRRAAVDRLSKHKEDKKRQEHAKLQMMKQTAGSVEELGMQVLSHSLFS